VDIFSFEDVEPAEGQIMASVRAAMDVANLNVMLVNAVNRLTAAARQQHADSIGLAQQQQRDASRLDAAWSVAASVREGLGRTDETLDRYMRGTDEICLYLQGEVRRQNDLVVVLLARTKRSERLLRRRVTDDLQESSRLALLRRFYMPWRQRGVQLKTTTSMMQRSARHSRQAVMNVWKLSVAKRRKQRLWFRHLDFLEDKNNRILAARYFQGKWATWVQARRRMRTAAVRLLHSTACFRMQRAYTVWMASLNRRRAVREHLAIQFQHLSSVSKMVKNQTMRRFYNKWTLFRVKREVARSQKRRASGLALRIHRDHAHRTFFVWLIAARKHANRRERFVEMARRNSCLVARKFFGKWDRWRWQRWVYGQIAAQIGPLERKVDIGLRTAANTNETIHKLIENFQYLESKLQEARMGARSGILGMRESSMASATGLPDGLAAHTFGLQAPSYEHRHTTRSASSPMPAAASSLPRHQHTYAPLVGASDAAAEMRGIVAGPLRLNPYATGAPGTASRAPLEPAAVAAVAAVVGTTTPTRSRTFQPTQRGSETSTFLHPQRPSQ
jgi:hypothetical protein